jgi:myo-inositol 2-dehydrogenase / D-chiro-inositol 1-dehydrogenase
MSSKDLSRRNFLQKTSAIGAIGALGMTPLLNSCGKLSTEELGLPPLLDRAPNGKKLSAGLIGCGHRGTGALMNWLSSGPGVEVGALADVFEEQVESVRERLSGYDIELEDDRCFSGLDAYERLMETDVDVVILATPPYFRPAHFKLAIEKKKHVFMEKPVAVDPVGIRSVIATGRKAQTLGLNVVTGTQRRHQRDYVATYEKVANGAIGKIVAAKAFWNQEHVWFRRRQEGWSDMEYMLRNWNNFIWLGGDHILDTHIHNIDIINWFSGKHPLSATGFGGRHRRVTGDQYDFFSIDFDYGEGFFSHSMCRQIDNCANGVGEWIIGTEGYTNCQNTIYNHEGKVIWKYDYPKDEDGNETDVVKVSPYIQEHIHLVTAIRTNKYVNGAEQIAHSNLTAIMGRESAYTGKRITWEEIMKSDMKLGPEDLKMGDVDMEFALPIPGTAIQS